MRVVWTTSALADVEAIQDFIAQHSPAAAYTLATDILERTDRLLSDNPMIGRAGRIAGTRELVVSGTRYIVAYRLRDQVELLAVMHGAREWPEGIDRFSS